MAMRHPDYGDDSGGRPVVLASLVAPAIGDTLWWKLPVRSDGDEMKEEWGGKVRHPN